MPKGKRGKVLRGLTEEQVTRSGPETGAHFVTLSTRDTWWRLLLNRVNDEAPVKVIRDGNYMTIPESGLVGGDLLC